jgi:hypothetical protein
MTSWILTFVIVVTVNGRAVEQHHTAMGISGPEHCRLILQDARRGLPRNARIERARCEEAWRT